MLTKSPLIVPVEGRDFIRLPNGVIQVRHDYGDLLGSYVEADIPDVLSAVDHTLAIAKRKKYEKLLRVENQEFYDLVGKLKAAGRSLILVFQGRDAAGKSGAIERIVQAIDYDFKNFQWIAIGPPTDEELAHPFLWRFGGQRLPGFGQTRAFDRSWNERVLVEIVDKLTDKDALRASFAQIRGWEWQRVQEGSIVVKIWMDISYEEQDKRFKQRKADKPRKSTDADEKARASWPKYTVCANEMFYRLSPAFAPWYIVSSEDKRYSRVHVLQLVNSVMRRALANGGPGHDFAQ